MSSLESSYPNEVELPTPELVAEWLRVDPAHLHYEYVDQNHDGMYEHLRWQLPMEYFPSELVADCNENGIPDGNSIPIDLDGDGFIETHLNPMDLDKDGHVDHWVGYTGLLHMDVPLWEDGFESHGPFSYEATPISPDSADVITSFPDETLAGDVGGGEVIHISPTDFSVLDTLDSPDIT